MNRSSWKEELNWEAYCFWLTMLVATSTIWIAERPPMVDLPQLLAQVVEWRALLEGRLVWADLLQVNYATPYLLGSALLLPLTYVISITAAAKLLLSIAFITFIALCVVLRRELKGDKRLDWLFVFGFFGFAWRFGFFQYLFAAPLVILFLIVALHQANANSFRNQLLVLFVGVLLLFSHGLQFIFAVTIGGLFILIDRHNISYKCRAYIPYYILAALTIALWWAMRSGNYFSGNVIFDNSYYSKLKIPFYILANDRADWWGVAAAIIAFATPPLLGYRVGGVRALMPFAVCVAVLLFVPHIVGGTAFVYHRFALFLLPFWSLAFRVREAEAVSARRDRTRFAVLAVAALAAIAIQAQRQLVFRKDSIGFETVLAAADPNRLALSLIYETNQPNSAYPVYKNYSLWYAVEKGGVVDFNFGYYPNSILRYRRDRMPALSEFQSFLSPESDISGDLHRYSYLFIRGTSDEVNRMMSSNGQCEFKLRAEDGLWWLFEKESCAR